MPTRRAIKGVLHNFLETYISRYSDYRGYWLHGQLPSYQNEWAIDLLGGFDEQGDTPERAARVLAIRGFGEQLRKSGLSFNTVREASLRITRDAKVAKGFQSGHMTEGHMFRFIVRVVNDKGRVHEDNREVFVAPHDAEIENRRLEVDWGP